MKKRIDSRPFEASRGTGRTLNMVKSLPNEAIIITPSLLFHPYLKDMICEHRGPEALKGYRMISIEDIDRRRDDIISDHRPLRIDHAVWQKPLHPKFFAILGEIARHKDVTEARSK